MSSHSIARTIYLVNTDMIPHAFEHFELLMQCGLGKSDPVDVYHLSQTLSPFNVALPKGLRGLAPSPGLTFLQGVNAQNSIVVLEKHMQTPHILVDITYLTPLDLNDLPKTIRCSLSTQEALHVHLPHVQTIEGSLYATRAVNLTANELVSVSHLYVPSIIEIVAPQLKAGILKTGSVLPKIMNLPCLNTGNINPSPHKRRDTLLATCAQ